jgi:hypothetical protein
MKTKRRRKKPLCQRKCQCYGCRLDRKLDREISARLDRERKEREAPIRETCITCGRPVGIESQPNHPYGRERYALPHGDPQCPGSNKVTLEEYHRFCKRYRMKPELPLPAGVTG